MLAIARSLMSRPKLILMDEPSLGLAPLVVKEIFRIIVNLKEKGINVLVVEQNAKQVLKIADMGYVMKNGKIVERGRGKDLLENDNMATMYLSK